MNGTEGGKGRTSLVVVLVLAIVVCAWLAWRVQALGARLERTETAAARITVFAGGLYGWTKANLDSLHTWGNVVSGKVRLAPPPRESVSVPPPPKCPPTCWTADSILRVIRDGSFQLPAWGTQAAPPATAHP